MMQFNKILNINFKKIEMKKNNIKYIALAFLVALFVSCEKDDAISNNIYDNSGQTGLGFLETNTQVMLSQQGEASIEIPVQATTTSSSDRQFNVSVNTDLTSGPASTYTLGTVTIPAGEYNGLLTVTLNNDNNELNDLEIYVLSLDLDLPDGIALVGYDNYEIEYFSYVYCNDIEVKIKVDNYGSETSWEILDDTNTVVASGGPYSDGVAGTTYSQDVYLADGCYTFTIYDSYGDGLYDGTNTGTYDVSCSIFSINHASGSGSFGSSISTDFCVNP